MRIALIYVFPNLMLSKYVPAAQKFVSSYLQHPPGRVEHQIHVFGNGPPLNRAVREIFDPIDVKWWSHNNWAKDLGAFMVAANSVECDLMVCAGSHVNFHRAGWLDRIVEAQTQTGPCVSGAWGAQVPRPHLRTTFFWSPPEILIQYPHLESEGDRYFFEHGDDSISLWSQRIGFEPYQVTWKGCYPLSEFQPVPLNEMLARDQHSLRDYGE